MVAVNSGKLKTAVLISGRGSNLQALIDATAAPDFPAEIALVLSNIPDVYGLERAQKADIPTQVLSHKNFANRLEFETALDKILQDADIELICLAGFMRVLTDWFVTRWEDRLVNIHPSLLPAFKGLHTHKAALENGANIHGCTVHFVRPDVDEGPIILQASVPVLPGDTEESLAARVLEKEHEIYPLALRWIAEGKVNVMDGKAFIID